MFTVGEFSRVAQVSKRLLRYYDEIGLFKPIHIDTATGYRYYSAEQMPQLNRILALKELGLTLDQIRRMLEDEISTDEMQGMLLLKKSEIEQQLRAELQRIRKIESRLQFLRDGEDNKPLNVILKRGKAQHVLSTRRVVADFEEAVELFWQIRSALPDNSSYGLNFCICYTEPGVDESMDMELGCVVDVNSHDAVMLHSGLQLEFRTIPAVDLMATSVVTGALETIHRGYADIALWVERNGYRMTDVARELTLQPASTLDGHDLITEIQVPVEPIAEDVR
ncbi:MAG: MerR family transcriptional regulator [Anaerolineae bacterium]|nr:MerR family transcriptional regulator [Anaerolineae bacterium]